MKFHNLGILGIVMLFVIASISVPSPVDSNQQDDLSSFPMTAEEVTNVELSMEMNMPDAQVIYVDVDATGDDDGTSWANAYNELTDALAEARDGEGEVEIWIAEGTYYPDNGTTTIDFEGDPTGDPEDATFYIDRSGISIYGGFSGSESSVGQRVPGSNTTILSGDIDENDGMEPPRTTPNASQVNGDKAYMEIYGDNAYHVLSINAEEINNDGRLAEGFVISGNIIDGVTIEGGSATGVDPDDPDGWGGGLFINGSGATNEATITLQNSIVKGNEAVYGGGIYVMALDDGEASLTITNTDIDENYAEEDGGGLYLTSDASGEVSANLMMVDFDGNEASDGAGIGTYSNDSEVNLDMMMCSMEDGDADYGGAIYVYGEGYNDTTSVNITQVEFRDNSADSDGGAIGIEGSEGYVLVDINTCELDSNYASSEGGAIYVYNDASKVLVDIDESYFDENYASSDGGAIHVTDGDYDGPDSTVININNSEFTENEASGSGGAIYGYSEYVNIYFDIRNTDFLRNEAEYGGAIYHYSYTYDDMEYLNYFNNVKFEANVAEYDGGAMYSEMEYEQHFELDMDTVTFNNNIAMDSDGGAIYIDSDVDYEMEIYSEWNYVTFRDNSAAEAGGAVYFYGYEDYTGWYLDMEDCKFLHNSDDDDGEEGAAIYFYSGELFGSINNTIFENNGGEFDEIEDGGAVVFYEQEDMELDFNNCIFTQNGIAHLVYDDPEDGDGPLFNNCLFYGANYAAIVILDLDDDKPMLFRNCIFWNNNGDIVGLEDAADDYDELGDFSFVDIRNSIIEEDTIQFQPIETPDQTAIRVEGPDQRGNIFADPLFMDTTPGLEDFQLQRGSPAIDAGNDNDVDGDVEEDFAGADRIIGCAVDMGPLESALNMVEAGDDREVCKCEFIQLDGQLFGNYTSAIWSGGAGTFKADTVLNTVYSPTPEELEAGSVTLTLTTTDEECTEMSDEVTFTFEEFVTVIKNCDGTITISWENIDQGTELDVDAWFATIYLITEEGNLEILDFDDLEEPTITLAEGALELFEDYIITITEVLSDGAATQVHCALPPIMNASPTYEVVTASTFGPLCDNEDLGNDPYTGQVVFKIIQPVYADCDDATFNVVVSGSALETEQEFEGIGFDEEITVPNVGVGNIEVALFEDEELDCRFMYDKCLEVPQEITTIAVEDTEAPELEVVIDDALLGTQIQNQGDTTIYELGTLDPGEDCCFTMDFGFTATDNCDLDPEITITSSENVTFEFNPGPNSQDGADLQDFIADGVVTAVFCAGLDSLNFLVTDENGLESTIIITATVPETQPSTNMAPATYYIEPCEELADIQYGFVVTDPCALTDLESVSVLVNTTLSDPLIGFPILFVAEGLYTEPRGENGIYIEFFVSGLPPGPYLVETTIGDLIESAAINVVAAPEPNLENLACNDNVNVTLDENCEAEVTADMVLEGDNICNEDFIVVVDYGMGEWEQDQISRCGTFSYEVFTINEEPVCWGYITGEDKDGPVVPEDLEVTVFCGDLDYILANTTIDSEREVETCQFDTSDNLEFTSWDLVREKADFDINDVYDNCTANCHLEFQISDLLMEGDVCSEGSMIVRTIKVTDEKGNSSSFIIRFIATQPGLQNNIEDIEIDECQYPNASADDYIALAGAYYYELCWKEEVDDALIPIKVLPDYTGKTASFCGYAVSYEDIALPIECDGDKIIRQWTYMNWCEDRFTAIEGPQQVIKVGAFAPPTVACNNMLPEVITTGGFDCTASLIVPHPIVTTCKGDFDYGIKVFQTVPELNGLGYPTGGFTEELAVVPVKRDGEGRYIVSNLPIGDYRLAYYVTTECGVDADEASCTFQVRDLTEPVAICDDELNISIGGEGVARISVTDIDEGSWDNCELVELKVRRSLDSCLDDYLNEVVGVGSLDDLLKGEQNTPDGKVTYWYKKRDVKFDTVVVLEPTKNGQQYFSWWADQVYFLCCDISKSADDFVVVEMRATDKSGNTNICWMDMLVENKLTPTCIAPPDAAFNCWDFTIDGGDINQIRAEFGTVDELLASKDILVDFNCDYVVTDAINWNPRECSEGTLQRVFTVTAPSSKGIMSSTCTQSITINKINNYSIIFPADAEDTCAGDGGDGIETTSYTCDILAIEADTAVFVASGDECYKRFVTYRVINWCEYDGISLEPTYIPRDVDCDGNFNEPTYVRVLDGKVWIDDDNSIDKKEPVGSSEEYVITIDPGDRDYTSLNCDGKEYAYTPGYWEYTQVIKVYDDVAPEIAFDTLEFCAFGPTGAIDCQGEVMIPFTVSDECTELVHVRSVQLAVNSGTPIDYTGTLYTLAEVDDGVFQISSINEVGLPVGSHYFVVKVADDCGNIQVREIPFTVVDCKTPAPVCTSILSADLMPIVENKEVVGGMNVIWSTDFIASVSFDCTPHPQADLDCDLRYYAVRQDEVAAAGLEAPDSRYLNEAYRNVTFTCDDEGAAVIVYVIGVDGAGNFDFCTSMVNVQPGTDPSPCGEDADAGARAAVAGAINTETANAVANVDVFLSGQSSNNITTTDDGNYYFGEIIKGYDYSIVPHLDANHLNGVSTFDMVIMTKHILGVDLLDSPYKMIAADINNSGSVTTLDLIQLRKLILSVDTEFSNNTSWKFVPTSYIFPNPADPWIEEYPQIINLNNLEDDMMTEHFVAIKIGDVNGSAIANSFMSVERNVEGVFRIDLDNTELNEGLDYQVSLSSKEIAMTQGFQFTLQFNPELVELSDIQHGLLKEENLGLTHVSEGFITVSWNNMGANDVQKVKTDQLLTLSFKAKANQRLNDVLQISSRYTQAEAYHENDQMKEVVLNFHDASVSSDIHELYQNVPNPFSDQTMISFYLPEAAEANLRIQDSKGSVIRVIKGKYGKGLNQININSSDLPMGVLYYTLETNDFTTTRKMIRLN